MTMRSSFITDEMIQRGIANLELQDGLGARATVSAIYASMRQVDPYLASGMEAPSGGETVEQGSTEGDSPVAESETPPPSDLSTDKDG